MARILIVDDGHGTDVLLAAIQEAYAEMRVSEESKGGVIVVDTLGTFKEDEQMLYQQSLMIRLERDLEEYKYLWDLKKDFSRSMFLTDARSKVPSNKGRKKKVNRLRVKKRVKARHRRNK